jgi:heat shock protein HtpX
MRATFRDLIADNKRKSAALLVVFALFTIVVVLVLALAIVLLFDPDALSEINWGVGVLIGLGATGLSFVLMLLSYYQGDALILGVSGAREIEKRDDPQLFNVVEEMAIAAGVPMPRVYVIDDSAPNAFATGRDPRHASVAITTGLREKLNREELQGVIAHEMSHVRYYDIRLMMLMAVLIGSIAMMSDFFWQMLRVRSWGGGRAGRSDRRDKDGQGALVLIIVVIAVILAIVAPILARIIQMAVSRQREYLADAGAVELTRNPVGLANALQKIDADPDVLEAANRGTAHLYIVNPIKKFHELGNTLFASHPPIQDRIARLMALVQG